MNFKNNIRHRWKQDTGENPLKSKNVELSADIGTSNTKQQ